MTTRERAEMRTLREEVRRQRSLLGQLARALLTHVRTDLPPDAALPRVRRLVARIGHGR